MPRPLFVTDFELNPYTEEALDWGEFELGALMPALQENPERFVGRFRELQYDHKKKNVINQTAHNSLPYLFILHDSWWEYEEFKKFPDYHIWYRLKFQEWHKHMIMKDYVIFSYDPMWCIDPKDPYYDFYMYYYIITLKYYKPWKVPIPNEVFYQSARPYLYILGFFGVYLYYMINHFRERTRWVYILMNEDWWIKEYEDIRMSLHKSSPFNKNLDIEVTEVLSLGLPRLFFTLRYGPREMKDMKDKMRELSNFTKEDYYKVIKK